MKRHVQDKWYGGISNDPNAGGAGSTYNIEGVDIHTDSKYVKLSKGSNGASFINNNGTAGNVIATLYEDNVNYLELDYSGNLTWIINNNANRWKVVDLAWDWANLGKITLSWWSVRGFAITTQGFHTWVYDANNPPLWTYAYTYNGINTDPSFDGWTWWTIGSNWSISFWSAYHTAWSTAVLSRPMSSTIGTKYRVAWRAYVTAGSCSVRIAWSTILTFTSATNDKAQVGLFTASSTSSLLEFVPSSDFVWRIDDTYVQDYYVVSTTFSFNQKAPYVIWGWIIYVWNGNKITQIDMSTGTAVISNVCNIDFDYSVKWITRIGDTFNIYATNGSNGKKYLWDGISGFPWEGSITYIDKPIINVANFANTDYLITGTRSKQQISIVNGYQLQPLIVTNDWTKESDVLYFFNENINAIETLGNRVLFGSQKWIYSFGKRTPWLPNAIIKEYINSGLTITSISYSESNNYSIFVYFYWRLDGVLANYRSQIYLRDESDSQQYGTVNTEEVGWIETNNIVWEVFSNDMILRKYTVGYKLEPNTSINTYIRDTYYATLTVSWEQSLSVWDVYSYAWRTFTIIDILNSRMFHCSYVWSPLTWYFDGTFTKVSGAWPATIIVNRTRYGYRLLDKITDSTKKRFSKPLTGTYNEVGFAFELISTNRLYTPKLYDFNLYYDDINYD